MVCMCGLWSALGRHSAAYFWKHICVDRKGDRHTPGPPTHRRGALPPPLSRSAMADLRWPSWTCATRRADQKEKKKKEPVEKEPTASLSELYQYASVLSFWHPDCLSSCSCRLPAHDLLAFQSMFNNLEFEVSEA